MDRINVYQRIPLEKRTVPSNFIVSLKSTFIQKSDKFLLKLVIIVIPRHHSDKTIRKEKMTFFFVKDIIH